jgi:hypothetical protein
MVTADSYALELDPMVLLDAAHQGDGATILTHVERAVVAAVAADPPPAAVLLAMVVVVEEIVSQRVAEVLAVIDA